TCDACHESGLSFYGVTNLTTRPSGHHVGKDCSGCHNTNNWDGGTQTRKAVVQAATRTTIGTVISAPAPAVSASAAAALLPGAAPMSAAQSARALGLSHAGVTSNC